jgi:hypothetical protein
MAGPYKMCDQCDGPGTRCKRCPLDDEANDDDDGLDDRKADQ